MPFVFRRESGCYVSRHRSFVQVSEQRHGGPAKLVRTCHAQASKHLLVPDEELLTLLAKVREEHTTGNLFENNGPDLDNAADEDPEGDDLHEDEVQDGCMRARDVKEAEEEEAPAEPSPLPAADVKEPVALQPEQALKPDQRMCKFLALRLAFGNPSASDVHKAALSGSSGSSFTAEWVSLAMKKI